MAMDKTTIMRSFNTLFFEFMDDILSIYPENKEIQYARGKFELLKKGNPSILIKFWKINVYDPYHEQINLGDISFFIQKDYRSDFSQSSESVSDANEKILSMIENVRASIRDMDESNRKCSADYILKMSTLSLMYSS
jgi:hypothetical protein|uniref:Uncharacterized protein n=1 Tax=viral metagenome TaxID=1070528 RepID=A0A6C0HVX9_9ZZZZ